MHGIIGIATEKRTETSIKTITEIKKKVGMEYQKAYKQG